jgi:hypothetical protein
MSFVVVYLGYHSSRVSAAASGFSRIRCLAQYQERCRHETCKRHCKYKRRPDRSEQPGKPEPEADQEENSCDHEQKRRGCPRHCRPFELPCPMLQVDLDAFKSLFDLVFSCVQPLMKLPGRPMNQRADPEPQPAWLHAQGRFSPIMSAISPPCPCRTAFRE